MKVFICQVCGHLAFNEAPANCPVCWAPKEKFTGNDNIFKESREQSPEAEVKHIPAVNLSNDAGSIPNCNCQAVFIRIGEVLHPAEEKHLIQFIDCYLGDVFVERMHLTAKVNPAGTLHLKEGTTGTVRVVIKCNIHGYWFSELNL